MSKPVKYVLIAAASLAILIIVAVVAIKTIVDVESYKPKIEQLVTEKTGYPLTLGGKISLSLFPWVGLSLTDLQLDNPEGFANKKFIRIDSFQARLKVLPLLSKKIEMSSFVLKQPEIYLEKSRKGIWNWQKLTEIGKESTATTPDNANTAAGGMKKSPAAASQAEKGQDGFALQSLVVGEFAITDGRIQINDLEKNEKREISAFSLQLVDVSLDKPIKLTMGATIDGKPLTLKGTAGPLGPDPGAGQINLDLVIEALETMNVQASGYLADLNGKKSFQLALNVEPFSPRQLFSHLGLEFPVATTDPKVLDRVGLQAVIAGDPTQVVMSDSKMLLDDSSIDLDVTAKDFSRPDLTFAVAVDTIDLDRYLPPAKEEKSTGGQGTSGAGKEAVSTGTASGKTSSGQMKHASKINYDPLRKLVLKGTMKLGTLKVHGGTVTNLGLDITGKNGLFTLKSLAMELYEGRIKATGTTNVQQAVPVTALNLSLQDVQVGPLLKDFAKKEIIEGLFKAEVAVKLQGDSGDLIKKTLNGTGDLLFQDGALIGLDLAQMARTIKSGFTLEQQGERPKTDFAELHAPFTITNGLVKTPETTLRSPFLRVLATGDANLVNESLDMRVKPTIVGTIKGQGDQTERSGLAIPILVGGTFAAPEFRPDLESLVKERMPSKENLSEMIKTGKVPVENKEQLKKEVEQAKGLLKGLFK